TPTTPTSAQLTPANLTTIAQLVMQNVPASAPLSVKAAVASVILNRIHGGLTTLAAAQASVTNPNGAPDPGSVQAVQVAAGGTDLSNGATYFYNTGQPTPSWASSMTKTAVLAVDRVNSIVFLHP